MFWMLYLRVVKFLFFFSSSSIFIWIILLNEIKLFN